VMSDIRQWLHDVPPPMETFVFMCRRTRHIPIELEPGLFCALKASPTSRLWVSIMEQTAAVCSQLLSIDRKRNGGEAEPSRAWRYGINEAESIETLVVENNIEKRTMDMQFAISARPAFVLHEPRLAELVQKETDARAGGADHLGQRCLTDLRDDRLRLALLPKAGQQQQRQEPLGK
jgi:hypothetical protein